MYMVVDDHDVIARLRSLADQPLDERGRGAPRSGHGGCGGGPEHRRTALLAASVAALVLSAAGIVAARSGDGASDPAGVVDRPTFVEEAGMHGTTAVRRPGPRRRHDGGTGRQPSGRGPGVRRMACLQLSARRSRQQPHRQLSQDLDGWRRRQPRSVRPTTMAMPRAVLPAVSTASAGSYRVPRARPRWTTDGVPGPPDGVPGPPDGVPGPPDGVPDRQTEYPARQKVSRPDHPRR